MTNSPDLAILDVGHGNTAVFSDQQGVIVIDAAPGGTLLDFLEHWGIREIDAVLISHADADHMGGLLSLLLNSDISVDQVYVNSDATKNTAIWDDFRHALPEARQRGTAFHIELTKESPGSFNRGPVRIEVLAPTQAIVASGPGGTDLDGRVLTSNSSSAVIRIATEETPVVLLAADLDEVGLLNLLGDHPEPRAAILVFPHHGGLPAKGNAYSFAEQLCNAVEPSTIIFSIGRGQYAAPRPEVVSAIRASAPNAYIACTQLSDRCASSVPSAPASHVGKSPARGARRNACCAGTIHIALDQAIVIEPETTAHRDFIHREAQNALCQE